MAKILFKLWDKHTTGFVRILTVLMIITAFNRFSATLFTSFVLIMWLIVKTGYEKKWQEEDRKKGDLNEAWEKTNGQAEKDYKGEKSQS